MGYFKAGMQSLIFVLPVKIVKVIGLSTTYGDYIWGLVRDSNPGPLAPKARVYTTVYRAATTPAVEDGDNVIHAATTPAVEDGDNVIHLRQGDENVDVSPDEEGHDPQGLAENQVKSWLCNHKSKRNKRQHGPNTL